MVGITKRNGNRNLTIGVSTIGDIMDTLAVHDDLKAKLSRIKK